MVKFANNNHGREYEKIIWFLMVGLAFTALQVAMVADAHAFSTQDMGVGLKFKDLADTVVPVTENPAVKEMEHKVQCAKIEDSDERTNCLNDLAQEIPTGQSLRNANRQLRSEPANPQVKVSPWLQSTIEPDTDRKPLEIGGN